MIKELCDVMQRCYERGWITTRDGNASFRRKDSQFIHITPSGARKNVLRVEDIIQMRMSNGELIIPNGTKPSGELDMHYFLQRGASKTRSILHVHPTHVIAAMYAGWELSELAKQFPELHRYTKVAKNVPVLPVTSRELADATYTAMCEGSTNLFKSSVEDCLMFDIVGQDRHGVCAVARDPWSAYEHVERLDHICEIVLKSGVTPPKYL
jgi:ribulose-5-phosphate 4-epimerase/fuculose-1-phosphate aldolase